MKQVTDPHAALSRLTPGQIEVLERVAQFKSSKQIARELGISWHTVDQRLKRVQSILDVSSRFDAARLYSEYTGSPEPFEPTQNRQSDDELIYEELVYQGPGLTEEMLSGQEEASPWHWGHSARQEHGLLAEQQAIYFAGLEQVAPQPSWLEALLTAGSRNELTSFWRVVIIMGIAVMAILSLAVMVNLVEGLSRLF